MQARVAEVAENLAEDLERKLESRVEKVHQEMHEYHEYELYRQEVKYDIAIAEAKLRIDHLFENVPQEVCLKLNQDIIKLRRTMMGRQ